MNDELTTGEIATLTDIANPSSCLIHDGETIEALLDRGLIVWNAPCFRLTAEGQRRLDLLQIGRSFGAD